MLIIVNSFVLMKQWSINKRNRYWLCKFLIFELLWVDWFLVKSKVRKVILVVCLVKSGGITPLFIFLKIGYINCHIQRFIRRNNQVPELIFQLYHWLIWDIIRLSADSNASGAVSFQNNIFFVAVFAGHLRTFKNSWLNSQSWLPEINTTSILSKVCFVNETYKNFLNI